MKYLFLIILLYPAYIIGNFWIDMRIENLRPYLNEHAIEVGAEAAAREYAKRYTDNEMLLEKKRKVRDKKLQEYADRLDEVLRMEK